MKIKQVFVTALAALALGMISVRATSPAPSLTDTNPEAAMAALFGDPVIAKGTGFEIKRSALDSIMTGAKAQAAKTGQMLPPGFDAHMLDQLITIQVMLQKATDADRAAGQHEADVQYTNILKHYGSEEAFALQLKAVGMTMDELRRKAREEGTAKAVLRRELGVQATDDEVKAFYASHPDDFTQSETVHVRHLLLMTIDPTTQAPLPKDQIDAKRKQIDELLKRARAGEDFATLAKQYSEDPGSKDSGGEYTFGRGQMVPEFEAAAFALTAGQISDVVTTKYGFHIIKLLDRTPAKKVELATVSDDIKNFLIQQKMAKVAPAFIEKAKKDAGVQIVDPTLKAETEAAAAAAAAAGTNAAPGTAQ